MCSFGCGIVCLLYLMELLSVGGLCNFRAMYIDFLGREFACHRAPFFEVGKVRPF